MQVRDLIQALRQFNPYDTVALVVIRDHGRDYTEDVENIGAVERDNSIGTVVIKPE